jgi:formyl-CoA transferase
MALLQEAGVAATPIVKYEEAHYDPHLTEKGFYELVAEPDAGVHLHPSRGFRLSGTPIHVRAPGPMLGEHNSYLYSHLLGYSTEEMRRFEASKHIGVRYEAAAGAGE